MSSLADKITTDLAPGLTKVLDFVTRIAGLFTSSDKARMAAALGPPGTGGLIAGMSLQPDLVGKGVLGLVHALLPGRQSGDTNITTTINGVRDADQAADKLQRAISDAYYSRQSPYGVLNPTGP
jgi:hypothetical protein